MRFNNGKTSPNGESPNSKSTWHGLMLPVIEVLLDNIAELGFSDGRAGIGARDRKVFEAAVRLRLTKEKLQKRALYQTMQRKIIELEEQLKRLCKRIGSLHEMIEELRPNTEI